MTTEKQWINPTPEMSKRKAYDIMIDDKPCPVYDIPDSYHSLGSANGSQYEDTYWIEYHNELCPFSSKFVHRICWEIKYKQNNYTKYKWDDWDFRKSGKCEIYANGKLIYTFPSYDLSYALAKAKYLEVTLLEFPGYNFLNPEENKGRKIYFYGLPATIQPSSYHPGEISIYPDYNAMPKEEWWKEYRKRSIVNSSKEDDEMDNDHADEAQHADCINWGDALSDGHINWFRK